MAGENWWAAKSEPVAAPAGDNWWAAKSEPVAAPAGDNWWAAKSEPVPALVPAVGDKVGQSGQKHDDIVPDAPEKDRHFVAPATGQSFDREQAAKVTGIPPLTASDGLHSEDLIRDMRERVTGSQIGALGGGIMGAQPRRTQAPIAGPGTSRLPQSAVQPDPSAAGPGILQQARDGLGALANTPLVKDTVQASNLPQTADALGRATQHEAPPDVPVSIGGRPLFTMPGRYAAGIEAATDLAALPFSVVGAPFAGAFKSAVTRPTAEAARTLGAPEGAVQFGEALADAGSSVAGPLAGARAATGMVGRRPVENVTKPIELSGGRDRLLPRPDKAPLEAGETRVKPMEPGTYRPVVSTEADAAERLSDALFKNRQIATSDKLTALRDLFAGGDPIAEEKLGPSGKASIAPAAADAEAALDGPVKPGVGADDAARRAGQLGALRGEDVPRETWQRLLHHDEDPAKFPLNHQDQLIYDRFIQPVRAEENAIFDWLRERGVGGTDTGLPAGKVDSKDGRVIGHTPRFVKDYRNWVFRMWEKLGGDDDTAQGPPSGKTLSTSASSLSGRTETGTVAEIEKRHGRDIYYKNALVNHVANVTEMRKVKRNYETLEQITKDPAFERVSAAKGPREGGVPKGWSGLDPGINAMMPKALKDRVWAPRVKAVMEDMFRHPPQGSLAKATAAFNRFVVGSLFFNPIPHAFNVAGHYGNAKGLSGLLVPSKLVKSAGNLGRAVSDVYTQSPLALDVLKSGGALMYPSTATANFYERLAKKAGEELAKDPVLWRSLGLKPAEGTAAMYRGVNKMLWASNDVFMLAHVRDLMDRGMSKAEAIKEAERHIPSYRIPDQVAGSRKLSELLQNPNLTLFGRYHYGVFRSYASMVRDAMDLTRSISEGRLDPSKMESLDQLLGLGFLSHVALPVMSEGLRYATGNPDAEMRATGPSSMPNLMGRFMRARMAETEGVDQNQADLFRTLGWMLPLAPATKAAWEVTTGRDSFTGKKAFNTQRGDLGQLGMELGGAAAHQIAPVGQGLDILTGKSTLPSFLWSLGTADVPSEDMETRRRKGVKGAYRAENRALHKEGK